MWWASFCMPMYTSIFLHVFTRVCIQYTFSSAWVRILIYVCMCACINGVHVYVLVCYVCVRVRVRP